MPARPYASASHERQTGAAVSVAAELLAELAARSAPRFAQHSND